MQQAIITATMRDGTAIVERAADFGRFIDLVLSLRADPDVRRLVWELANPPDPPPAAAPAPPVALTPAARYAGRGL